MAVDMAKAFDTLLNGFLEEVLKFFGFGPEIRKWLTLLGKNRTACILLDEAKFLGIFSWNAADLREIISLQTRLTFACKS